MQEDTEVAKGRYKLYQRGKMQIYNLILDLRSKMIRKEKKEQAHYSQGMILENIFCFYNF